jgi:hypothetical protein
MPMPNGPDQQHSSQQSTLQIRPAAALLRRPHYHRANAPLWAFWRACFRGGRGGAPRAAPIRPGLARPEELVAAPRLPMYLGLPGSAMNGASCRRPKRGLMSLYDSTWKKSKSQTFNTWLELPGSPAFVLLAALSHRACPFCVASGGTAETCWSSLSPSYPN